MTQSMSRVGRCIDNGPIEAFWGPSNVKSIIYISTIRLKNLQAMDEYIQFYNHDRLQKRLNGLSPIEYRAKAA